MIFSRAVVFFVIIALVGLMQTLPARATMSTAQEVVQGAAESAKVDNESLVVQDPFLTSWLNGIGAGLAQHRQRADIQYRFTILADPDINAFALKGGYVHVNLGLLNFVGSDDELASTLAHEMGHVELRHVVRSSNSGTIIGILTALASLLSPVAYVIGGLGSELAGDKFSRAQELQADHYGLALMSKAGYDPRAAVDVMSKLGGLDPGPESRADKAFIDHPVPQDRISHLLGYPQLDSPSADTIVAQAIHDQREGRYSYATARLREAVKSHNSGLVNEHKVQLGYALRESGAEAAPDGRVSRSLVRASDPRRAAAATELHAALGATATVLASAKTNDRAANFELDDLVQKINKLAPALQSVSPGPSPTNGAGRGAGGALAHLTRDISGTIDLLGDVLQTAPGLVGPNTDTLREMAGPLEDPGPLTPKFQALLAFYPSLTSQLSGSNQQILDSIQRTRDAIAVANDAVQLSQNVLVPHIDSQNASASPPPRPNPQPAIAAWDKALRAAQNASDVMYAAQTAGLSAEITMLDLLSSQERYAAFRQALGYRFPGVAVPDYEEALNLKIAPGEMVCAGWLSFESKRPLNAVLEQLSGSGQTCAQLARDQSYLGESMEIAEGLIYEDYVDTPPPLKR